MSCARPRLGLDDLARRAPDREAMVLAGDGDLAGADVLDRVVRAAVAERQLVGLQAGGAGEQLVAEADAEHGLAVQQRADVLDDVVQRGGVARAGDEEEAVGVARQQLLGRRRARVDLQRRAAAREVADDRALDAGVERDDRRAVALAFVTGRLVDRDLAREIASHHARLREHALARLGLRHVGGEDAAAHRARGADVLDERARVDARDPGDAVRAQPAQPALLGAGRVVVVDGGAHDRAGGVDPIGLHRCFETP